MTTYKLALIVFVLFFNLSCYTQNNLKLKADLPNALNEVSGTETILGSELIWMLNDKGNAAKLFGVDKNGRIMKELIIDVKNNDWEDLTSDFEGNIYIGDFGNNNKDRKKFTVYKISQPETVNIKTTAVQINFSLPKGIKSKDFEAFFIYHDTFYIFSKEKEKSILVKVPNIKGNHLAEVIAEFNLDEKDNRITSADISEDGKTIILLNHNKIWIPTDFKKDDFFNGTITSLKFNHSSQKEGVCFKGKKMLLITDEKSEGVGGNLYEFEID